MAHSSTWPDRISGLAAYEKVVIAVSVILVAFLIVDPLVLTAVRGFDIGLKRSFQPLTGLGRSNWILIPSGLGILLLAWLRAQEEGFRRLVAYGFASQLLIFLFAAVALSGLTASLTKNILGRARPKLFEQMGPLEFQPFSFDHDFASFPSGHATTAGALAAFLAILWPRARVAFFLAGGWVAATRFLIGTHYFTDAVGGFALGVAFVYLLRNRMARRRWLFRMGRDGAVHLRGRALLDAATGDVRTRIGKLIPRAISRALSSGEPRQ